MRLLNYPPPEVHDLFKIELIIINRPILHKMSPHAQNNMPNTRLILNTAIANNISVIFWMFHQGDL